MTTPIPSTIKAVFFDFMGTCLDWHTGTISTLPSTIPEPVRSKFALDWRQAFFDAVEARVREALEMESVDDTLRKSLDALLQKGDGDKYADIKGVLDMDEEVKAKSLAQWHHMSPWPDVSHALEQIKQDLGLEIFVVANGTTRLQLDLCHSSGLKFDMLFSSQLLGCYKPAREAYERVLELVGRRAEEVVMVAAHVYDLRGAREVGMKTVYVERWTDDVCEDKELVRGEVDYYLEGMEGLPDVLAGMQR